MSDLTEAFKETKIGLIPVDWEVVLLRDAATLTRKPRELNLSDYEAIPFIPMELVPDNGTFIEHYELRPGSSIRSGTYCEKGDILLAKITPSFENGKQGIVGELPVDFAYATTEVYPIRARPGCLDQMFLFHFLRLPSVRADIAGKMEGSTGRQRVPKAVIENHPIPLPPLPEQRRIAHVLSAIQRAIAAQNNLIVAGKETKRSLMQRLFTYGPGPEPAPTKETEIGEIPEHWEVVRLGELCQLDRENVEPQELPEMPYVGLEHIESSEPKLRKWGSSNEVRSSKHHFVPRDVLYGKLRPYLDKAVLAEFEGVCSTDILVVKANAEFTLPEFLVHLLHTQQFLSYAISTTSGTNLPRTRWTSLRDFKLALPPLPEQRRIASILQAADRKIEGEEQRKAALQALFKSMLCQLMTGQVRVPELVEVLE